MFSVIRKNGLLLALCAAITSILVTLVYGLTKEQIKKQEEERLATLLEQVIPIKLFDNNIASACTLIENQDLGNDQYKAYIAMKGEQKVALAIESTAQDGYNGEIKLLTGIDNQGKVLGVRVVSHQETPGLGDKIDLRISNWILSFDGQYITMGTNVWDVRKYNGQFDQFTGATITPRAVVKAVWRTVNFVNQNREYIYQQEHNCVKNAGN